ncbi:MAG TPA: DUF2231 domain-containing protein [Brevundimonas sp.]|nr:DUF2231 domain-containing protein [Brevundimonas sp.]
MAAERTSVGGPPNPLHAILLAFPVALFSSALVTDIVYLRTAQVQWTNFSAWLICGALLFGGLVLLWALIGLVLNLRGPGRRRSLIYVSVLASMWVVGLVNAFKHSQDGWSSVGTLGLALSILCTVLALAAGFIAHSSLLARSMAR